MKISDDYRKCIIALKNYEPEDYYIAYFDVLGYKYLIQDTYWFMLLMRILKMGISCLNDSVNEPDKNSSSALEVKYKVFSDNILICSKENWSGVFNKAVILQKDLIKQGVFIRGGMCYGKLYFDDDFIGGQGLIKAVDLENEAKFPRIIIDETFISNINVPVNEAFGTSVAYDEKCSRRFIDYLTHDYGVCQYYQGQWAELATLLIEHQYRIRWNIANCNKNIEMHKNDAHCIKQWRNILEKYEWCKNYHNDFCTKYSIELSAKWKNITSVNGLLI